MATSFSQWLNQKSWRKTSFAVISASVIASTLTVILKQGGGFEYFDLGTYDKLIRLRLAEKEDNRILTVLITEDDIQAEGKWPISDATLAKSLNNLSQHNPYGIGIDLYRDLPVEPGAEKLKKYF